MKTIKLHAFDVLEEILTCLNLKETRKTVIYKIFTSSWRHYDVISHIYGVMHLLVSPCPVLSILQLLLPNHNHHSTYPQLYPLHRSYRSYEATADSVHTW